MRPLRELRLIPAIDRHPTLQKLAQTPVGQAALLGVYGLVLFLHGDWHTFFFPLALVLPTFLPAYRRPFIAVLTVMVVCLRPRTPFLSQLADAERLGASSMRLLQIAFALFALAACAGYLLFIRAKAASILAKRPVAALLGLFIASLVFASLLPPRHGLFRLLIWLFLSAMAHNLWFLCYSLKSPGPRRPAKLLEEVCTYNPVWQGTTDTWGVPIPKGGAFLDRIEASTPEALAVCQLKGLKLTMWATLLALLHDALFRLLHGTPPFAPLYLGVPCLGIPTYEQALGSSIAGAPLPFYMSWLSLVARFISRMFAFAVTFHLIIGACRMAGFRALRGIYRPFEARSLADFWNRVHFYFKELLVEFFFYPTFLRYFRNSPRLRMFAATFAAACFGNFLQHFPHDLEGIALHGFLPTIVKWQPYALYCLILALGIGLSQMRSRDTSPRRAPWHARIRATFAVMGFYCLLNILDDTRGTTLGDCGRFFMSLFPWAASSYK